jgi:hypothetical protein
MVAGIMRLTLTQAVVEVVLVDIMVVPEDPVLLV